MMEFKLSSAILVVLSLLQGAIAHNEGGVPPSAGMKTVLRVYDECSKAEGGFVPCLKKKAITFLDRISVIDTIGIGDGIRIVRSAEVQELSSPLSENELESTLPRGIDDRDSTLTRLLVERVSSFFSGHTLQVTLPKISSEELGRGLEEGRGKMKKMAGMMMMGMAMKLVGLIPIAIAALYILAGKALIVSKIALLLAGIIGLKKLMSGRGGASGASGWSSGGGAGGWSSGGGGGGGHGGWDRRSMESAQDLAYRAHSQQ